MLLLVVSGQDKVESRVREENVRGNAGAQMLPVPLSLSHTASHWNAAFITSPCSFANRLDIIGKIFASTSSSSDSIKDIWGESINICSNLIKRKEKERKKENSL
jgi:hypothetical protein